jgi:allophanate hydrolase subunit 2
LLAGLWRRRGSEVIRLMHRQGLAEAANEGSIAGNRRCRATRGAGPRDCLPSVDQAANATRCRVWPARSVLLRRKARTPFSKPFALTDAFDRMGVRLSGPRLEPEAALDMPSEPTAFGSIQVAGDGVPTVLLADHQTTGGYPKIATVVSDQVGDLVQHRSRSQISFRRVEPDAALQRAPGGSR